MLIPLAHVNEILNIHQLTTITVPPLANATIKTSFGHFGDTLWLSFRYSSKQNGKSSFRLLFPICVHQEFVRARGPSGDRQGTVRGPSGDRRADGRIRPKLRLFHRLLKMKKSHSKMSSFRWVKKEKLSTKDRSYLISIWFEKR